LYSIFSNPFNLNFKIFRKARKVNPNLHIFCELFSGDASTDAFYTKVLGANALLKEAQHLNNSEQVSGTLHHLGRFFEHSPGSLEPFQEIDWRTGKLQIEKIYEFF
jgi:hypothetical protein